jgi:hypothetical protein
MTNRFESETKRTFSETTCREMMTKMREISARTPNRLELGQAAYMRLKQIDYWANRLELDTYMGMRIMLVNGLGPEMWRVVWEDDK